MLDDMDRLIQRFNNTPDDCQNELITHMVEREDVPNELVYLAYKCSQVFIRCAAADEKLMNEEVV